MTDVGTTPRKPPTQGRLQEVLRYDPETGLFRWLADLGRYHSCGDLAGTLDTYGHVMIIVDGVSYLAHRLAWLYMLGEWPIHIVDHKNNIPADNRWGNLRQATRSQNNCNARIRKDNTIGLKGVSRHGKRFRAQIQVNGKKTLIGVFDTAEMAHSAYASRARDLHGEFARLQ